jgi:hypothetical protein
VLGLRGRRGAGWLLDTLPGSQKTGIIWAGRQRFAQARARLRPIAPRRVNLDRAKHCVDAARSRRRARTGADFRACEAYSGLEALQRSVEVARTA